MDMNTNTMVPLSMHNYNEEDEGTGNENQKRIYFMNVMTFSKLKQKKVYGKPQNKDQNIQRKS